MPRSHCCTGHRRRFFSVAFNDPRPPVQVLAQLATPVSQNFSRAVAAPVPDPRRIRSTGGRYATLLRDMDLLLATHPAFLLGPWLAAARRWGMGAAAHDCASVCGGSTGGGPGPGGPNATDCAAFYEWNARVQLTTWHPTPPGARAVPKGPVDYAAKHWSGLVGDYYGGRVELVLDQALLDAAQGRPVDWAAVRAREAAHAHGWTTASGRYPLAPVGDAVGVSRALYDKYSGYFRACA